MKFIQSSASHDILSELEVCTCLILSCHRFLSALPLVWLITRPFSVVQNEEFFYFLAQARPGSLWESVRPWLLYILLWVVSLRETQKSQLLSDSIPSLIVFVSSSSSLLATSFSNLQFSPPVAFQIIYEHALHLVSTLLPFGLLSMYFRAETLPWSFCWITAPNVVVS